MDDEAEVENALVALLDFDKFDLIKELLRNRLKIVWCTRRERAQSEEERTRIEVRGVLTPCRTSCAPPRSMRKRLPGARAGWRVYVGAYETQPAIMR